MKSVKIILFLFPAWLFIFGGIKEKRKTIPADKWKTMSIDFKATRSLSEYEVRLTFTGYTSLYGTAADCHIRKNGTVVLAGSLSGNETVDADDDIVYTGILQLTIDVDICSAKRLPNGEDKLCGMTVTGSGPVMTELQIQYDQRGGYIKTRYDPTLGIFKKSVVGDCDQKELMEEENMVPNETIASVFNGTPLPMLTNRTLRKGTYVETGDAGKIVVEVLRVIKP
jgi:hypothetical protein